MAEPTTPTWELLQALQARLQAITVANGYRSDLGADVRLEPPGTTVSTPLLVVVATGITLDAERSSARQRAITVDVAIEAYIPASRADAQQLAHEALADIVDALPARQRDLALSTGNTGVELTNRTILQRPEGAALIVAQVTARAGLVERPVTRDLA